LDIGPLNLVFENTRITAKRAVVQGDSLKIFMHVRNHDSTYATVNQEDTINVTLSGIVNYNTKPLLPLSRKEEKCKITPVANYD